MEPAELARLAVEAAAEKRATDVVMLDIRELSTIADYFVICTGATERQVRAIVQGVMEAADKANVAPFRPPGIIDPNWALLDYGDVVFHAFTPATRQFYKLDRLWQNAPTVVRIQ